MTLTTPMKVILAVVLIGVIALGFYLLDWQKKLADSQKLDTDIIAKSQDFEHIKAETRSLTTLVQENDQLHKEYDALVKGKFQSDKPENPEAFVPDFISQLEQVVAQVGTEKNDSGANGFSIITITPSDLDTKKDPNQKDQVPGIVQQTLDKFPKRKFNLQLKGHYDTLIDFLDKMGTLALNRLVTVDRLSLTPGGIDPAHPTLTIQIPLTAYLKTTGGQ
jgi:Tfp pilus assembly protein PilO